MIGLFRHFINKYKKYRLLNSTYFRKSLSLYNSMLKDDRFYADPQNYIPIIDEFSNNAASVDIHYFLQDYYMSKKINQKHLKVHYDIGSRIDGFVIQLLSGGSIK